MDRIEDLFPAWEVQAEMTRRAGEEGGTISSAVFQGQNNSNYIGTAVCATHSVHTPPLIWWDGDLPWCFKWTQSEERQ